MTPALALLLALGASPDPPCADVYDRAAACAGLQDTPLADAGEEVGDSQYDETPLEVDPGALGWQFIAVSGVAAAGAGALQLVWFFYGMHMQNLADAGELTAQNLPELTRIRQGITWGAVGMWFSAAMIAGTGLAFWAFDPATGELVAPGFE